MTGAAWVAWDGNYSFDADGTQIPVESLVTLSFPRAPLSGLLQFTATGAGTFEAPRYDVRLRVDDLFAGDEGIGQVTGRLSLRGEMLTMDFDAASPRLAGHGSGRLALTPEMDAELTLQLHRHVARSVYPVLRSRSCRPSRRPSPTARIRAVGELSDIDHLVVEATVDRVQLKLFDYPASNEGPIKLALDRHTLEVQRFRLVGEGTAIELSGNVGAARQPDRARQRRAMPTSASCRVSFAIFAAPAPPHSTRRSRVRSTRRSSPATRRSRTDASVT